MKVLALSLIIGNVCLLNKSIGKSEFYIFFSFYKRTSVIITDYFITLCHLLSSLPSLTPTVAADVPPP